MIGLQETRWTLEEQYNAAKQRIIGLPKGQPRRGKKLYHFLTIFVQFQRSFCLEYSIQILQQCSVRALALEQVAIVLLIGKFAGGPPPHHISPHSLPRWQARGLPRPQRTALRLSKDQKCWARYLEETILKAYDSMQESCRSCCTRNANICAPQSLFNTSGLSSTELSLLIVRTADRRLARLSGVSWVGMGSLWGLGPVWSESSVCAKNNQNSVGDAACMGKT